MHKFKLTACLLCGMVVPACLWLTLVLAWDALTNQAGKDRTTLVMEIQR